jgi:short-subunit dehydrogenase
MGTAVITGASGGIGGVYADRLGRRGYDLVLVARNKPRLDAVASAVSSQTGRTVRTIAADLATNAGVSTVERLLKEDGSITMLVNDAGVGAVTPLLQSDPEKMSEMIKVNVDALMRPASGDRTRHSSRGKEMGNALRLQDDGITGGTPEARGERCGPRRRPLGGR